AHIKPIGVPIEIDRELRRGGALAVSISGGKDSQAMLVAHVGLYRERDYKGPLNAIHADLGRIKWRQTPGHVRFGAARAGVPRGAGTRMGRCAGGRPIPPTCWATSDSRARCACSAARATSRTACGTTPRRRAS